MKNYILHVIHAVNYSCMIKFPKLAKDLLIYRSDKNVDKFSNHYDVILNQSSYEQLVNVKDLLLVMT